MYASFQSTPDLRPYKVIPAQVDVNELNTKLAWGASKSRKLNFSKEDAVDDLVLNELIWHSVRGAHSPMPAPIRAAFVFTAPGARDND